MAAADLQGADLGAEEAAAGKCYWLQINAYTLNQVNHSYYICLMSRHFIFISFFLIHSITLCAQNVKPSKTGSVNDREQLLKLENDWLKAEFVLDTAFLSSVMDKTFIGISTEGVHNKQEDLLDMYNTHRTAK